MYNVYKNRWNYTTKSDKIKFISVIHIISLAAVLQYFLYNKVPQFIVQIFYEIFAILGLENWFINILYILEPGEMSYILYNIIMILTAVTVSLITGIFLIVCLKRFATDKFSDTYIYNQDKKDKISYKFKLPKNTPALLITGICIVQFSAILYALFNSLLYNLFGIAPDMSIDTYFPQTVWGIGLYFITLVITPAVAEEFIFRYIMLNALKKYGNVFAITVTSVLFGFAHGRASAFIYATAIGFFLAYMAIKTKSIWFSMIMHAVINAIAFGFQYLYMFSFADGIYGDIIYYSFLCIISLIGLVYLLILIIRRTELKLPESINRIYIGKKQKFIFFFNIASIIFFVLTIAKSMKEYSVVNIPGITILK